MHEAHSLLMHSLCTWMVYLLELVLAKDLLRYGHNTQIVHYKVGRTQTSYSFKGQLISECLLGVIDFPKNQRKIWQISALESKKWSNQQSKSTFFIIIWLYGLLNVLQCLYFMIWPLFRFWGRYLSNFSLVFWKI